MELKGWIARDNREEDVVYLYRNKPKRMNSVFFDGGYMTELPAENFPEVTWENSPVEVTIKIKKV